MELTEFLGHIDPIFFRIPAGKLEIPTDNEPTQVKADFIQAVYDGKLEVEYVFEILTDLGLRNGLHKIPVSLRLGAAEIAASLINEPGASSQTYQSQETNKFIEVTGPSVNPTAHSLVAEIGISAFLELIDPIFFRIPSKEFGISSENSASDLKELFIKHVEVNNLDDFSVLSMMTELAQRNGLHKVSQAQRDSASRYSEIKSPENVPQSLDSLHYVGMAVAGFMVGGTIGMLLFGSLVPGASGFLGIAGAVIAVILTKHHKKSKREENSQSSTYNAQTRPSVQTKPQSQQPVPRPVNEPSSAKAESQTTKPAHPTSTCTECGDTSPDGAIYCISCGNNLFPLICPKCQTENISRAKFCMSCGEER